MRRRLDLTRAAAILRALEAEKQGAAVGAGQLLQDAPHDVEGAPADVGAKTVEAHGDGLRLTAWSELEDLDPPLWRDWRDYWE